MSRRNGRRPPPVQVRDDRVSSPTLAELDGDRGDLTPQTPGVREFELEHTLGADATAVRAFELEHTLGADATAVPLACRVHSPLARVRPHSPLARPGGSPLLLRASSPLLHDILRAREAAIETIRSCSSKILGRALSPQPPPYALVWSDEFDYEGPPDPAKWGYQVEANRWTGRPENAEAQWYTQSERNARVSGGTLKITAHREECSGCEYTSARLFTKGKGDWTYGRIEVCAKLPAACRGVWPAIWMLPSDQAYGPWPKSGELDLMENAGFQAGELRSSVHTGRYNHRQNSHVHGSVLRSNAHCAFHVYALEWSPTKIAMFVDTHRTLSFHRQDETGALDPMAWPFDQRFHLVLNVAVGGHWAGQHGIDDAQFPCSLEIRYVRVYQRPPAQQADGGRASPSLAAEAECQLGRRRADEQTSRRPP